MLKKLLLLLIFSSVFLSLSYAGDRMVLVERFTSSTCPPCASNNPIMDAFLAAQDPDRITGIAFHMNWPAPGNDPMYLHNPTDNDGRRSYYGINYIPQAKMDGIQHIEPAYNPDSLSFFFNSRKNILSPVTIIMRDTTIGDSVKVFVRIYCESALSNPNVTLYFAAYEKHIHYTYPPGTNGETDFYDVMRKMLPVFNGQVITLVPGQVQNFTFAYRLNSVWQTAEMRNLVFIQAQSKEILNAALKTANFTMVVSPGYKSVQQGQSANASFYVKTPYVANGYNSPVTFTAAVDPPNAGITVSFPNGTTLSNFGDSLMMNVSSTSGVAAGEYSIIVTGTNTNNKVHKYAAKYLVGKNYVYTACTRPNLLYKIDGVNYNIAKFFVWDVGSTHTIAPVQPQTFGSTRYVFQSWNHGGDSVQSIVLGTNEANYIINYKIQFKLTTSVSPSGIPATITNGNIFHDSASAVTMSISPLMTQYNGKTYWFQRWQGSGNGSYTGPDASVQLQMNNVILENAVFDTIPPIGIKSISSEIPQVYKLHQNYPNPFNPVTNIKFDLPKSDRVSIIVYDILGNVAAEPVSQLLSAGYYEVSFDASYLSSGVYFYQLKTGVFTEIKKMIVVK